MSWNKNSNYNRSL